MAQVDELQTHANALADAWSHRLNAVNYENNANIALSKQMNPVQSAVAYSVGQFLADIGSFGDLFGGGGDKDNGHPGTVPAPDAPASTPSSHWTTVNYAKDSWDYSEALHRNGGAFTISNRMPYSSSAGFNWWR